MNMTHTTVDSSYFLLSIYTGYLQIHPIFHHKDNDIKTESLNERNTTYYLCTATISISSSLEWRKLGNDLSVIKHVTPHDTPLTSHDVNDLCQLYAEERTVLSLTVNSSIVSTSAGFVSQQTAALVICNMEPSLSGAYQCVTHSSLGETTSGPQISVSVDMDNRDTGSPLSMLMVIYITLGSVVIAFLLLSVALLVTITYSCLRYKSKPQPTACAIMPRERMENIYHEIYPGEGVTYKQREENVSECVYGKLMQP